MKYCPNCGATVEPGAASCESCGTELSAVRDAVTPAEQSASAPPAGLTVADLSPRQLRKEIRWGVFQGILLALVIGVVVYLVVVLLIVGAVIGASGS